MKPLDPPYTIMPTTLEDASDILTYLKTIGGESHHLSFGEEGLSITLLQEQQHIQEIIDHPINCEWKVAMMDEIVGLASISAYPKNAWHIAQKFLYLLENLIGIWGLVEPY